MFDKKTVYHSQLVAAGKLDILIVSDPIKSKFQKKGEPEQFYVDIKVEGKPHQYIIENDSIHKKLAGLKGHVVELTATGSRDDADVTIFDAAGPASGRASATRAEQPSQTRSGYNPPPPPPEPDLIGVKTYLMKAVNARVLCQEAAVAFARAWEQRHGEQCDPDYVDTMATSFYIDLQRKGMVDALPWEPIPPKATPRAKEPPTPTPPPPPPRQAPPPSAPDDDDIPF